MHTLAVLFDFQTQTQSLIQNGGLWSVPRVAENLECRFTRQQLLKEHFIKEMPTPSAYNATATSCAVSLKINCDVVLASPKGLKIVETSGIQTYFWVAGSFLININEMRTLNFEQRAKKFANHKFVVRPLHSANSLIIWNG